MTYSIRYEDEEARGIDGPYAEYAVDWGWAAKERWARSVRGGPGSGWQVREGVDGTAHTVILEHFGLEEWKDQLPLEKITKMSWWELGAMRREMEKKYGLERKEIKSDTIGCHISVP